MILDQQDQPRESLVSVSWTQAVKIVEIMFFIGVLTLVLHLFVGAVALICLLGKLSSPPFWMWIELTVLVYILIPVLWIRLLFVAITYQLRPSQKEHYGYIFLGSLGALLLALNLPVWYSSIALLPLSIAYISQWAFDARLPKQRKKPNIRQASYSATPKVVDKQFHTNLKQTTLPRQEAPKSFQRTEYVDLCGSSTCLSQRVGIWHSPADEKFAERLRTHLQPKIRQGMIDLWDASHIQPGALWQKEREQATQSAAVAVVLVSADLMACDFIANNEIPHLLHRAMTQGTVVLLLHINSCDITGSGLERFHPLNLPDRPLAKLSCSDREQVLTKTVHIICQRLGIRL